MILVLGSLLMFVLTINSGDPLAEYRESNAQNRENLIKQRIEHMGLDDPWYVRYWNWLSGVFRAISGRTSTAATSMIWSPRRRVRPSASSSSPPSWPSCWAWSSVF
ncbi:ABC transporter permease family protein [Tessaracoccus coleopterorum]|uniref:hypothetical protein n=1 Tax=Tessaracoccus coleopterorum TaxID=2714950 RepID=UPI0018D3911A|nr:hypothetical protein [Tessaracoccus coleopterorum]